ncbi:1023_t:CDS:2 [Diversispora eburnea]|uniref:1023_t:CDS:1 n=1 Tax=Diversispora eburnea TaxID=1213867 RepID=A0A9N8VAS2_9GLOM|nr:1023_t:CDS:2 [Diversispora eburnea]
MNSLIVDSGNKYIDDFIKEQFTKESVYSEFLEWVPYDNLTNLEFIGKGGFSEIYRVTWEKNSINYGEIFETKKSEVSLKVLNDSQNVDSEFIKELKYTYQLGGFNVIE